MQDQQTTLPFRPPEPSLQERAERWMDENPAAMELFRRFAEQMRAAGRRFGIGQLTERVRWECNIALRRGEDGFRINNNHRAYIARRLIADDPRLAELLETRGVRI